MLDVRHIILIVPLLALACDTNEASDILKGEQAVIYRYGATPTNGTSLYLQLAHNGSFKKYWLDESDTLRSDGFEYVDVIPDTTWMLHGDSIRLGYDFWRIETATEDSFALFGPKRARASLVRENQVYPIAPWRGTLVLPNGD
jgi:hypothetical protein